MSGGFLVDTNVISELAKPRPNESVEQWLRTVEPVAVSSVTVLELTTGVEAVPAGKRRRFFDAWLARLMRDASVVPFDGDAALVAGRMSGELRRSGRAIGVHDLMIAATARTRKLTVATRNVGHFTGLGVSVYDPFTDSHAL